MERPQHEVQGVNWAFLGWEFSALGGLNQALNQAKTPFGHRDRSVGCLMASACGMCGGGG
jgi:hypothetical protein